jgi:pimeloyl-ACP methyl ester carboxylesterase
MTTVRANGLTFAYHQRGDGPRLALLLHGFPDDAGSMLPLAERLAARGFTAVAPFMRGYGPTDRGREHGAAALAGDVVGLIAALGHARATVIGHDWGAVAGYAAATLDPARVERLVALAVPPPRAFLRRLRPAQLARSSYMALFQAPWLAERLVRARDWAMIDALWARWSPGWTPPPGRVAEVKRTLATDLSGPLAYYRALRRPSRADLRLLLGRAGAPTTVVAGERDGCIGIEMFDDTDDVVRLPGVGHFIPLEATDAVAALI